MVSDSGRSRGIPDFWIKGSMKISRDTGAAFLFVGALATSAFGPSCRQGLEAERDQTPNILRLSPRAYVRLAASGADANGQLVVTCQNEQEVGTCTRLLEQLANDGHLRFTGESLDLTDLLSHPKVSAITIVPDNSGELRLITVEDNARNPSRIEANLTMTRQNGPSCIITGSVPNCGGPIVSLQVRLKETGTPHGMG